MHHHTAYGLRLRSNQPLPGLPVAPEAPADVTIDFAGRATVEPGVPAGEPLAATSTETLWALGPGRWLLRYTDPNSDNVINIHLAQAEARIHLTWTADVPAGFIPMFVLEPVLKAALLLRDVPCLHASTVAGRGWAIAFLGPSGAGKSTLAAACTRRGLTLLSDDVAVLDHREDADEVWVQPGYPRLRLTAASSQALDWATESHAPWIDVSGDDKTDFHLAGPSGPFTPQPARLTALYVLGRRRSGREARSTLLPPRLAIPHLVENLYLARWLDPVRRAAEFRFCARLAAIVPVYELCSPDDLSNLVASLPSVLAPIAGEASTSPA